MSAYCKPHWENKHMHKRMDSAVKELKKLVVDKEIVKIVIVQSQNISDLRGVWKIGSSE